MSKDHKTVLKECVEAPFGKAEEILKKEGYWNEMKAPTGPLRTYKVRIDGEETIEYGETITVDATSPDEAMELAEAQVPDHVDITNSYIVSSK